MKQCFEDGNLNHCDFNLTIKFCTHLGAIRVYETSCISIYLQVEHLQKVVGESVDLIGDRGEALLMITQ